MARIHVLEATGPHQYRVVVHDATPAGNNGAGVAWATALVNSGRASTVMPEGSGPGQITTAERNQVLAGTVLEAVFDFGFDPALTPAQRNAALDAEATKLIAETQAELAAKLRFFGATRG